MEHLFREIVHELREIKVLLEQVVDQIVSGDAVSGNFVIGSPNMAFVLKDNDQVGGSVSWTDAKGQPATVASTTYASTDPTVAGIADDGAGGFLITAGNVGNCQVSATADDGAVATLDIQVVGGDAATGTITPGTPVPQTPPAPAPTA